MREIRARIPARLESVSYTHLDVYKRQAELHSEIESILITEHLADHWTYPLIQPELLAEAKRRGYL